MGGRQQWPPEVVRIIQQFEQRIKELEEENKQLKKRITQLENKLRIHENPHTPPSSQRFKGNTSGTNPPGKRGAPPGHHGATRNVPEPDEIIPVTMDTCPRCGSHPAHAVACAARKK